MGTHPGTSYRQALERLIRKEETEERELRQEFDRRVEHQIDTGFKSYDLAAERVLRSDPKNMAMAYADATDQAGLARRVGEVMAAAKKAATAGKIPLSTAVMRILARRGASRRARSRGDWLNREAMTRINNLNLGSRSIRRTRSPCGSSVNTYPEVDADVANRARERAGHENDLSPAGSKIDSTSGLARVPSITRFTADSSFRGRARSGPPGGVRGSVHGGVAGAFSW